MKIKCKCGHGCDYEASTYERVNKLNCSNSRQPKKREYNNVHAITIKYIGPTNNRGSRVSITSDRFKERVLISYDYSMNNIYDMAISYLETKGFTITGLAETKNGYILITNNFKSIKN